MEKTIEIPEGYKARIEGNKVILEPKESEDKAFIELIKGILHFHHKNGIFDTTGIKYFGGRLVKDQEILAWLEKQATPQVRTGIEWVNTIDDACDKRYAEEYAHGEYCHEQSFRWGFFEGVEWHEKQGESKPIGKLQLSEELYEHIRNTCACIDDALSSETLTDIKDYLSMAERSAQSAFDMIEKQCSQNLADSAKTCKVEPKFKVGDWIINEQSIIDQIVNVVENVTNHTYGYDTINGEYFNDYTEGVRLWTIQDAKDGDVLATDTSVFIYAEVLYNKPYAYCGVDKFGVFKDNCRKNDWTNSVDNVYPATKEQRDLLFQKMKEAEYEWDADKKELKKIEQKSDSFCREHCKGFQETGKCFVDGDCKAKREAEQNPAWSEEDREMRMKVLKYLSTRCNVFEYEEVENWLTVLKERYTWKPSDEQLEALEHSLGDYNIVIFEDRHKILTSLYQDLKKRKG